MAFMMQLDVRKLDLRLLYVLEVIHRTGSITAAADILHLTQPALSHSLKRLRVLFDDPLFIRSSEGMRATAKADELAESIRRIQSVVADELAGAAAFDPKSLKRVFRICMTDVGEMVLLPKLIRTLGREAPLVDIETVTLPPREMAQALDSGAADLAVGPFSELETSNLRRQYIFERGFLCMLSEDLFDRCGGRIDQETYLGTPHAVVSSSTKSEEVMENFLSSHGYSRNAVLTVPHMLCLPAVVREAGVIATIPQSAGYHFSRYEGIRVVELPFKAPLAPPLTNIMQFWSARFDKEPAIKWLRTVVADLYQRYGAPTSPIQH